MFRKQSFWKGSALLLASAMTAKLLGACFKIPLTNVLGGTGMGYFSTAYGLLLPVYALSVTGLSAAVAQTVSRAAALEHWSEVRRIHHAARLACGALGLLLSLCMFLLAEPFATQIAAQPHALFSLLAIAPAALFGCLTAVERGYWEGLQNMTPTALSQALEAVAKLGFGLALCMWVLRNPEVVCRRVPPEVPLSALAAAGAVLGVTLSTVLGWVYFLLHGLRRDTRLPHDDRPAAPVSQIFRRLLYVMIPVALGSLVTNLTSLLDLVTMMRCLGRVQMFHGAELAERFGAFAAQPDFPAFVYGSFTGMAITVFNLVPSVTNMLGKSALPCAAALWAKQDCLGTAAHVRSVTGAAAAMAFPAAGGLWVLAEPVMHLLYAGRPEEAAIAAEALRTLLPAWSACA
ncbi:MAG: oligosaccharide flippase family protein [Ruminococcus callidus]